MDIQKEREAFEKLIDIEIIISEGFKFNPNINQYYHQDHTNHRISYAYLMGAWMAWQAAKVESHKQAALYQFEINHLAQANQQWREKAANAQATPDNKQFNLNEFLEMEQKLDSKDGVITADLDRFIAYAEMVLEKAKALKEPK